jgi:hypothetical protein
MALNDTDEPLPAYAPSALDAERIRTVAVDGKVESEAFGQDGCPVWTLFRYPLTAKHRQNDWPCHFMLLWQSNGKTRGGMTDDLIRPEAVIAFLQALK